MAVSITNNLTTETNAGADATTGWTASQGPASVTAIFREASGCLGMQAVNANEDEHAYLTITSTDFSTGRTLFGWMQNSVPTTQANLGMCLLLGDGTNDRAYAVGGSDNYGHFVVGWSGFRLDSLQLPATTRNITGAGAPTLSTITRIGYGMRYAVSAFGKVNNLFFDIIRHIANGSAALSIAGGTTGDRGTFAEITADDASTADGKAYGILRVLTAGSKAYEMTFGIEFGAATGDTYFSDNNFQLVIDGTNMSAGNMDVDLIAGTGTNLFILEDGVIANVGTASNWDMSAAFETLQFNGMTCSDMGTIAFPSSGGTLREVKDCVFNNCGQVTPNTLTFTGNTFNGTTDANGAILLPSSTTNMSDLTFVSDGTGHAIYITATGTYTLTDFNFSGYGLDGTTDAVIYNNSGGAVTLNISGGSGSVTVRNGASASTTIQNTVTFTVSNIETDSEVRILDDTKTELTGIEQVAGVVVGVTEITNGGTGYTVNDTLTVTGGTGTAAVLNVDAVSGGVITAVSITNPGSYTVNPTNPVSVTGGTGSNAQFRLNIKGTFAYQYNYTADFVVTIIVFHLNYKDLRFNLTLSGSSSTVPVQQIIDRTYSNP